MEFFLLAKCIPMRCGVHGAQLSTILNRLNLSQSAPGPYQIMQLGIHLKTILNLSDHKLLNLTCIK